MVISRCFIEALHQHVSHSGWTASGTCSGSPSHAAVTHTAAIAKSIEGIKRKFPGRMENSWIGRLHLDVLPDAAVENVIRFLSRKPHHSKWAYYVSAESILALLRFGGPLAAAAKEIFTDLYITELGPGSGQAQCEGTVIHMPDSDSKGSADALIEELGGNLSKLCMYKTWLRKWIPDALAPGVSGLRHLSLVDLIGTSVYHIPLFLSACGNVLEVLELGVDALCERDLTAVATHCVGLRRVVLKCKSLSSSLAPVWRAIGSTLEDVTLIPPWDTEGIRRRVDLLALPVLSEECCISRVHLLTFKGAEEEKCGEALCISFGEGLRNLVLYNCPWEASTLQRIAMVCPNVNIDFLDHCSGHVPVRQMVAMGPRASALVIADITRSEPWTHEQLSEVGTACRNVKEYRFLHSGRWDMPVASLFEEAKPAVLKVSLTSAIDGCSVFKGLTEHLRTLVEFRYQGPCPSVSVIRRLVSENKSLLKVIHLVDDLCSCYSLDEGDAPRSNNVDSQRASVVSAYLESRSLQDLQCFCENRHSTFFPVKKPERGGTVANVCWRSRGRNINVWVCGVQYL